MRKYYSLYTTYIFDANIHFFPVSFSGYIQRPKSVGVLGFVPQQHEQIAAPFFLQHESTFMAQYLPQRCE